MDSSTITALAQHFSWDCLQNTKFEWIIVKFLIPINDPRRFNNHQVTIKSHVVWLIFTLSSPAIIQGALEETSIISKECVRLKIHHSLLNINKFNFKWIYSGENCTTEIDLNFIRNPGRTASDHESIFCIKIIKLLDNQES